MLALSTPFGQRGWFYEEWIGSGPWRRIHIPWTSCPRIAADFIAEETRALGQAWVDQEYNGLFTAMEGLVFPDFDMAILPNDCKSQIADCKLPDDKSAICNLKSAMSVGGIDFGLAQSIRGDLGGARS